MRENRSEPDVGLRTTPLTLLKQLMITVFGWFLRGKVVMVGRVAIPLRHNFIVAINHLNGADSFVVAAALRTRLFFIAHAKWFVSRFSRFFMTHFCDGIAVETGNPLASLAGLRRGLRTLRSGGSVGIFPEGNFNLSGRIDRLENGAAYLAIRSGTQILPVIIRNLRMNIVVDESSRQTECWTGFLSLVNNFLNRGTEVLIGDPISPDARQPANADDLRVELARINTELQHQFDELTDLAAAA